MAQEGLGLNVGRFLRFLYANIGMIWAWDSEGLKSVLRVIIGLFRLYGIIVNVSKSWTVTYQPGSLRLGMSEKAVG